MATDAEIRGRVLALTYDLRHTNGGWVPTSEMNFSGSDAVGRQVIGTICGHLAKENLIEWKPLRGPQEGFIVGMAKITGYGVDVFERKVAPPIDLVLPNSAPPQNTAMKGVAGDIVPPIGFTGVAAYGFPHAPAPSDAGAFQAGTFDAGTFDTATFDAAGPIEPRTGTGAYGVHENITPGAAPPRATSPSEGNILPPAGQSSANDIALTPATAALQATSGLAADATIIPGTASLHREMLSRIAVLEEMIGSLSQQPAGMGHNNPPGPIEGISFGDEDRLAIAQAVAMLKAQPVTPTNPADARDAATKLKTIGERLWTDLARAGAYGARQADVFISEAVKAAGAETGKRLVQYIALAGTLLLLASTVHDWLGSLLH